LELANPAGQRLVDLGDGTGELRRPGGEQLLNPGQRHSAVGQGLDPDQVDDGASVVPAVA